MRRARIKALASVPIRKNPVQDTTASETNSVPDEKQKKEDITEPKQEPIKDVANKQKEECISDTDKAEQEIVKDAAKVEETVEEKQREASFVEPESSIAEKKCSQELHSQIKSPVKSPIKSPVKSPIKSSEASQVLCSQAKLNSQEESYAQTNDKPERPTEKSTDQLVQKSVPLPLDVPASGTDITSPAKNRLCFMRPVPRLDTGNRVRKNSIQGSGASASESEDEHGKRAASGIPSRVRNDSTCSVQSYKESTTADSQNQNVSTGIKPTQKRRVQVSESARRLAEARREFLLKHENKVPDKSQMKMYDFIYYNPTTNPMTNKANQKIIPAEPLNIPEEEEVDDPSAMPVPQVKVGPDGQLIIDERSLVIEQKDARRVREIMSNDIIVEEGVVNNGGFYKKHKRSKDWPKWETLKFYRVLNVVGTDFLLMQTLFPNRTRQEIKQKYKKEERINRRLIEKALENQVFDTDLLEEQLASLKELEKVENIQNMPKKTEKVKNGQSMGRTAKKRKHRLAAESIGECEETLLFNDKETEDATVSTGDEIDVEVNSEASSNAQQIKKGNKSRRLKRRLDDRSDISDNDSASPNSDSDSSPEVYQVRPTRSGRQPKKLQAKRLQAPDVNMLNKPKNTVSHNNVENKSSIIDGEAVIPSHVAVEVTEVASTSAKDGEGAETCSDNITNVLPNINQMEPGSLVIVSKESPEEPGNTILQVYMVSSNNTNVLIKSEPMADSANLSELMTETKKPETAESINVVGNSEK